MEAARLTVEAFRQARARGRDEVWATIKAFAPVLDRLGVLGETWQRIRRVEQAIAGTA